LHRKKIATKENNTCLRLEGRLPAIALVEIVLDELVAQNAHGEQTHRLVLDRDERRQKGVKIEREREREEIE
jgi:hypothetical protein